MSDLSRKLAAEFRKGDDIRDAGLKTPATVRRYDDIVYGRSRKWQILDLYVPKKLPGKPLPVIISVHGGGWFYGDKERYQYYCMSLVRHGFGVVNFTYRLAPQHKFPAPLEDTNLVVKWVLEQGPAYHLDPEQVFLVGDSAGAQLAGSYAAICTNPRYAEQFAFQVPAGFVPKAVGLNCGVYAKRYMFAGGSGIASLLCTDYLPEHGSEQERDLMDVCSHVTPAFPPAFVLSSAQDYLRPQAPVMANALIRKKVPVCMHIYSDPETDLNHVFHVDMRLKQAAQANKDECDFFRTFLK